MPIMEFEAGVVDFTGCFTVFQKDSDGLSRLIWPDLVDALFVSAFLLYVWSA